jgi:hypothetical protein
MKDIIRDLAIVAIVVLLIVTGSAVNNSRWLKSPPQPERIYIINGRSYVDGFNRAMMFRSYTSDENRALIVNELTEILYEYDNKKAEN